MRVLPRPTRKQPTNNLQATHARGTHPRRTPATNSFTGKNQAGANKRTPVQCLRKANKGMSFFMQTREPLWTHDKTQRNQRNGKRKKIQMGTPHMQKTIPQNQANQTRRNSNRKYRHGRGRSRSTTSRGRAHSKKPASNTTQSTNQQRGKSSHYNI